MLDSADMIHTVYASEFEIFVIRNMTKITKYCITIENKMYS